ncbi:MAG: LacI family DNA-binding transcriptional regulator, partial [Anaerolineaceae bacterium]|nr:LacI family DNA-binding transcriptional regulator [Anaerolineaceae bacterium]
MGENKRVTSQDVAKHAGVSRTTVSFVLNNTPKTQISEETRQRVVHAAAELGYIPDAVAQSLASGRSKSIGLVLTRSPRHIASDTYLTQVLDGLMKEVQRYGMRLLLELIEEPTSPTAYLNLVGSKRIDGIIFSGPRFNDRALLALYDYGFPTVLMGQVPDSPFAFVDIDNRAAAHKAVSHLLQLGHRNIACITNADIGYTAPATRLQGYREAMEKAGVPYHENRVLYGDFDPQSGFRCMEELLKFKPFPTAVFVASDVVAIGVMAAIYHQGLRIPEDISLVGFDDVPIAQYLTPALTTVHLPAARMAEIACDMLFDLIQGKPSEHTHVL